MKNIISLSLLFLCAAVFVGSDPEKDFVQIPAEPGFTFARDLQNRGPRGEAGEKSPIMKPYRMAKYPVNNAGCWPRGSALETSVENFKSVIELNLYSVFHLSKISGEKMKAQQYGRIINLGSIAGEVGLPVFCAYSAAKAGVIMLTKTMAMELAKCSVTINCVSPGMIKDQIIPCNGTWIGRCGTGEEVARAIVFLAADESGYITGSDFPVDGGRTLGPHS